MQMSSTVSIQLDEHTKVESFFKTTNTEKKQQTAKKKFKSMLLSWHIRYTNLKVMYQKFLTLIYNKE